MNNIRSYLLTLLQQAGFAEEEDNLDMLLEDLEPLFLDRMLSKMALKLSEDDQKTMFDLIEKGDIQGFDSHMRTNINDYDAYFEQVKNEFGKEYLEQFE